MGVERETINKDCLVGKFKSEEGKISVFDKLKIKLSGINIGVWIVSIGLMLLLAYMINILIEKDILYVSLESNKQLFSGDLVNSLSGINDDFYGIVALMLGLLSVSVILLILEIEEEHYKSFVMKLKNLNIKGKINSILKRDNEDDDYNMVWYNALYKNKLLKEDALPSDVYRVLNRGVVLNNGYVTRLYKVLYGDKEGIKITTEVTLLDKKEDKYKELLITDKKLKTEEDLKYVFDTLYNKHKLDEENDTTLRYYKKLKEDEEERLNKLNYIKQNLEDNKSKGENVKDMLLEGFSKKQKEGIQDNVTKTLEELKEEIIKIKVGQERGDRE